MSGLTPMLYAQTWDGGASNDLWSSPQNWNPNGVPASDSGVTFAGSNRTSPTLNSDRTVSSLSFASGASTFTLGNLANATLTVGSGGLNQASSNGQIISAPIKIGASQTWTLSGGDLTLSGPLSSDYATLTKAGVGTLSLSGNNSGFQGPFAVNAGTVVVSSSSALGTNTYGNSISSGASLGLSGGITLTEGDLTLAGPGVNGSGALQNITGANTLAATVSLAGNASMVSAGGTLSIANSISTAGNTVNLGGPGAINTQGINGGGFVVTSGAGSRTFNSDINAGFRVTGSGAVTANGNINAGTSSVTLEGSGQVLLAGTQVNAGNLTINRSGATSLATQVITTAAFSHVGPGTTTLGGSGTNYFNSLVISGGELVLEKTGGLAVQVTGGGPVTVTNAGLTFAADNQIASFNDITLGSGATLNLGETSQSLGDLVVSGNSIVDFGPGVSVLDLETLTILADATLTILNWDLGGDRLRSNVNPGSQQLARIIFADLGGVNWNADGSITPVPEPATYGVVSVGGLVAFAAGRRRLQRKLGERPDRRKPKSRPGDQDTARDFESRVCSPTGVPPDQRLRPIPATQSASVLRSAAVSAS